MKPLRYVGLLAVTACLLATSVLPVAAQAPAAPAAPTPGQGRSGQQTPQVVSPEVASDRRITFRLYAPEAEAVRVSAGDIPGLGDTGVMTKDADGVWTFTTEALPPGAYRYRFDVDGLAVIDPRSPATSTSNNNVWSLALVPGSDIFDTKEVPHGAVAAVTYYSEPLGRHRRMHVYTPPGYENGTAEYPVFYLLHGAGDSDEAWTSVGRAAIILDNLIAANQAEPMIVVMPAGHTNGPTPGIGGPAPARPAAAGEPDEFTRDFTGAIRPYVESHYRVINDRAHRAIAGLSMGGSQTLNIAIPHLDDFGYVGVFSSGILGGGGRGRGRGGAANTPQAPFGQAWEKQHLTMLDNAAVKEGLELVWFSIGVDDFLLDTSRSTVALLERHGFDVESTETAGGHTWLNWRDYLSQFTPLLFK